MLIFVSYFHFMVLTSRQCICRILWFSFVKNIYSKLKLHLYVNRFFDFLSFAFIFNNANNITNFFFGNFFFGYLYLHIKYINSWFTLLWKKYEDQFFFIYTVYIIQHHSQMFLKNRNGIFCNVEFKIDLRRKFNEIEQLICLQLRNYKLYV